jgi:hypothetical protein
MIVCYSTQRTGFEPHIEYRNPRYFEKPHGSPELVRVIGDWPKIAKAYQDAGFKVECAKVVKPPEVITDQDIAAMRKPELAEKLIALGVEPPAKVADMRAAYRALVIADDRPPLGEILGDGKFRTVFAHADNPKLVVKIEKGKGANAAEWAVWQAIKGTEYEPHFAPLHEIGEGWLTQTRAEPVEGDAPAQIPTICSSDAERRNFGVIDGRIVCIDMGNMLPDDVTEKAAFRAANWRN